MNSFIKYLLVLFVAVPTFGTVGCGDDTTNEAKYDDRAPDTRTPTKPKEEDPVVETRLLEAVSPTRVVAEIRTEVRLEVALLLGDARKPMAEEMVDFTILQAPDGTLELSDDSVATDVDGIAAATLIVGEKAGQIILRASHPGTTPVEFVVDVTDLAPGQIEVSIFPPAGTTVNLAPYRVRVYDADRVDCQAIAPRADLAGASAEVTSQGELVLVENMMAERSYTVLVQAMGTSAAPIAYGCVDAVDVETTEVTKVSVSLRMIPLNPTGTYKVTGFWDISEAVRGSGQAGNIVVGLIDFMSNPGMFIYDLIIAEVQNAVSFDITTFLNLAGIPTLVADTINGWIFQNAELQRFQEIAQDLQTMLYNLEVESELVIEKTDADLSFVGYEHWQKIVLNLNWQCGPNSAPDCGRYEIPVDANGNLPGLGYVSYDWTGQVVDYDKLELDSLQTDIKYGALLVLIIEQVVIPELTGGNATTLAGALSYWVDCPGLAQQVAGGTLCIGGNCLGQTLVDQACQGAMATAANTIIGPLMAQDVTFDLVFAGTAQLKDTASNGWVDEIRDGLNEGTMVSTGSPVTVEWSAELIEP